MADATCFTNKKPMRVMVSLEKGELFYNQSSYIQHNIVVVHLFHSERFHQPSKMNQLINSVQQQVKCKAQYE